MVKVQIKCILYKINETNSYNYRCLTENLKTLYLIPFQLNYQYVYINTVLNFEYILHKTYNLLHI